METQATVIVGAGIIGLATAFYLTELGVDPSSITIIESAKDIPESASGYAAGFLAKDWFSSSSASLGALSFALHAELAAKHDGGKEWGYSRSTSYSLKSSKTTKRGEDWLLNGSRVSVGKAIHENKLDNEPPWLNRVNNDGLDMIGKDTSAQVDPRRLTLFLLRTIVERGVVLCQPCMPTNIRLSISGAPQAIDLCDSIVPMEAVKTITCNCLIIAAGAWTPRVYQTLFPEDERRVPISPLAGHSLLLRTNKWTQGMESANEQHTSAQGGGCHAIFSSTYSPGIGEWSPEIFSRAGGEIYIAGLNDPTLPLPRLATDHVLEPKKLAIVMDEAKRLVGVGEGSELEILRQGLCFRPVTDRGTPIIGQVRKGVYIAAGHGPWGISLSLGTGKVVAEMLLGRKLSADISQLGL